MAEPTPYVFVLKADDGSREERVLLQPPLSEDDILRAAQAQIRVFGMDWSQLTKSQKHACLQGVRTAFVENGWL